MAFQSVFKIVDWKKENSEIDTKNSVLFGCGSSSCRRQKFNFSKYNSLKYFNSDIELKASTFQTKVNDVIDILETIQYNPYRLASNFRDVIVNYPANCVITSRSVISKIMNTPFEINKEKRKWIIKAKLTERGFIKLYYDEDSVSSTRSESFLKHDELLKNYLFTEKPQSYCRKIISLINDIFIEMYKISIGDHDLAFTTETPGVIFNEEITDIEKLRLSEHIYYELIDSEDFSPEVMNYNPIWWSKAVLFKAKQCIIGVYNRDNDNIQEIIKFNVDKFEDERLYENTWSPKAAWNFLNDFLSFVKNELEKIPEVDRKRNILKFQSFYNDKPYVVCERIQNDI
ncbi:hypothetical protein O3M35_007529 [Rhynocoris fuscipes]|uniref:RAI1-like domain-containing protein n=1 Tax=Rhynocoris fuscipes TaxID=488301 RepID=A0AAW1DDE0_9HEMI